MHHVQQLKSQSHHSGIETERINNVLTPDQKSQSHHSGIETNSAPPVFTSNSGRNRTIVGLKHHPVYFGCNHDYNSRNRTIVGLKRSGSGLIQFGIIAIRVGKREVE